MEKIINEEELKILEEEIDQAVDRLFVEKKKPPADAFSAEAIPFESLPKPPPSAKPSPPKPSPQPSPIETSYEMEKSIEFEQIFAPPPLEPSPSKWLDKIESRLLSLEWEITEENLSDTKGEVIALKDTLKENPNALSILNLMEKALDTMIQSKGNVHPSFIQFLLDSKETLRLLLEAEKDREIRIFKQLAFKGIEARFACLEPNRQVVKEPPSPQPEIGEHGLEILELLEEKIGKISDQVDSFSKRVEESLQKIQGSLLEMDQRIKNHLGSSIREKGLMAQVLIFKVSGRLFGIESQKVVKLFKLPYPLCEKYANSKKLQLRNLEVNMVNLKKIFSLEGEYPSKEVRILAVKEDGEVKGLMIDEIIKSLSAQPKIQKTAEQYFSGMIHWTYQDQPVEVPILDLTKL